MDDVLKQYWCEPNECQASTEWLQRSTTTSIRRQTNGTHAALTASQKPIILRRYRTISVLKHRMAVRTRPRSSRGLHRCSASALGRPAAQGSIRQTGARGSARIQIASARLDNGRSPGPQTHVDGVLEMQRGFDDILPDGGLEALVTAETGQVGR